MKKISVVLALAVGLTALLPALPAQAATQRKVYVQVSDWTYRHFPVTTAVNYVDYYSGVDLVLGKCRSGYKCIRIYGATLPNASWVAVTYLWPSGNATIKMSGRISYASYRQRRATLVHELAHAVGVYAHNRSCASVMYWNTHCPNGSLSGQYFDYRDKTILRSFR